MTKTLALAQMLYENNADVINVLRSSFELIMSQITNISLRGFGEYPLPPQFVWPWPLTEALHTKRVNFIIMIGAELAEILGIRFWPWLQTMNFKVKCLGLVGHEYLGRLFCY